MGTNPVDANQLLSDTFDAFATTARWPLLHTLQARYGLQKNVRLLAAELGRDLLVCEEGEVPFCRLGLGALAAMPAAAGDMEILARAVRFVAESYAKTGHLPVTHVLFQQGLDIPQPALQRLGLLLRITNGPWNSSSWSADGTQFSVTPNRDALFFSEVQTYQDLVAVGERLRDDERRIADLLSQSWRKPSEAPIRVTPQTSWHRVDRQMVEMRAMLAAARTEEQLQAVGLFCREVLISLAEAAHDPQRHVVEGVPIVSRTDAKRRLTAFFNTELRGSANEEARRHAKAAVDLAVALQHKRTADYRTAALCAEATTSVVALAAIAMRTTPEGSPLPKPHSV